MIRFEILEDRDQQHEGLRHRESLDPDSVLVFTNIEGGTTFDSEHCKFPFGIAALDKNNVVIKMGIVYPQEELFHVPEGTVNVIEGTEDLFERHNVRLGEKFPQDWRTRAA